jgi:hypothetical protein
VNFEQFLIQEYKIGESSARYYIERFKGLVNKGIYNGETDITPSIEVAIEREFPSSRGHYILALKRYMAFRDKIMNG